MWHNSDFKSAIQNINFRVQKKFVSDFTTFKSSSYFQDCLYEEAPCQSSFLFAFDFRSHWTETEPGMFQTALEQLGF